MNDTHIKALEHVRQFLNGLGAMEFQIEAKAAGYAWIHTLLLSVHDPQLGKSEKGLWLDFLQKVSGYSRIQVKRFTQQSRQYRTASAAAAQHSGVSPPLYPGGHSTPGTNR